MVHPEYCRGLFTQALLMSNIAQPEVRLVGRSGFEATFELSWPAAR